MGGARLPPARLYFACRGTPGAVLGTGRAPATCWFTAMALVVPKYTCRCNCRCDGRGDIPRAGRRRAWVEDTDDPARDSPGTSRDLRKKALELCQRPVADRRHGQVKRNGRGWGAGEEINGMKEEGLGNMDNMD